MTKKQQTEQAQHRMFLELVRDLERRTPETTGLGWGGWRLTYTGIPRKQDRWQDPFVKELGRQDNGKWREVGS